MKILEPLFLYYLLNFMTRACISFEKYINNCIQFKCSNDNNYYNKIIMLSVKRRNCQLYFRTNHNFLLIQGCSKNNILINL